MNVLVVSATEAEIEPSKSWLEEFGIDFVVTGVGMVATAYALGKKLSERRYDLLINVGIAGSWTPDLAIGEVVEVSQDRIFELGSETPDAFIPIEKLGFGKSLFQPVKSTGLESTNLSSVDAITVNRVHGRLESINVVAKHLTNPTIESMEGAAFFYAAEDASIPAHQIRAISNYVEPRNTANWNIPLAINQLNDWLKGYLGAIQSS